jgi:tRNA modification GTPase
MREETIIAPATAQGQGALSVLRLSGPRALELADLGFADAQNRPLSAHAPRVLVHGFWREAPGALALDELMAVRFAAPASATGECLVELQAHGGAANTRALLRSCLRLGQPLGLRLAQPGEFTRRAFGHGKLDLAQAEAVAELVGARSEAARAAAARQLTGGLGQALAGPRQALLAALAKQEAALDFPEDQDQALGPEDRAALQAALAALQGLLKTASLGRRLREGFKVALAGRPNTGKSSLLNALLGRSRALVHAEAGTTRDWLEEPLELEGLDLQLIDTAGLRGQARGLEAEGAARGLARMAQADLLLLVLDADQGFVAEDAVALAQLPKQPACWVVWNKVDLRAAPVPPLQLRGLPMLALSAKTGAGLPDLKQALAKLSQEGLPGGQDLVLTQERHAQALAGACAALERALQDLAQHAFAEVVAAALREALDALGEILGQSTRAELLDLIFSRFCIGK